MINFKLIFFVLIYTIFWLNIFLWASSKASEKFSCLQDWTLSCCTSKRLKSKPNTIVLDGIANVKRESIMYCTLFKVQIPHLFPCPNVSCHYTYKTRGWTHSYYGAWSRIIMCWYYVCCVSQPFCRLGGVMKISIVEASGSGRARAEDSDWLGGEDSEAQASSFKLTRCRATAWFE